MSFYIKQTTTIYDCINHATFSLHYHLILVIKYHRKVITDLSSTCLRSIFERIKSNDVFGGALFDNTTLAHFKTKYKFLKEVDSVALANVQLNVNQACSKLFANNKKPTFRAKRSDKCSYTTNWGNGNIFIKHVSDTEKYIQLPKLGLVKIILHRNIPGDWVLKHITVKEKASGKFYISLIFTVMLQEVKPLTEFKNVEAFDYSMLKLVVSASGKYDVEFDDIHWYKKMQDKLVAA